VGRGSWRRAAELREWFGHDPSRFAEFRRRYTAELGEQRPRLSALRGRARAGTLTLVYAARDSEHNDAVVLGEILRRGLSTSASRELRSPHAQPATSART
jgi:uncharacterized protein YeaO (DUF488 family)